MHVNWIWTSFGHVLAIPFIWFAKKSPFPGSISPGGRRRARWASWPRCTRAQGEREDRQREQRSGIPQEEEEQQDGRQGVGELHWFLCELLKI